MMSEIQNRVSQVLGCSLFKKSSVTNLLSSLTTSYVMSLESVMDKYGDNVMDTNSSIEGKFLIDDEYSSLNKLIKSLVKEDQDFIDMFYRKGLSQKQISIEINMSEATVSRKHTKLIETLRDVIGKYE